MARYTQRHSTATLAKASQALLDDPKYATRKWAKKGKDGGNGNFQRLVTRATNGTGNLDHARAVMIRRLNNVLGFNA